MTGPIYQLFIERSNVAATQARKALSEEEQASVQAKESASRTTAGASMVLICNSAWSDESQPSWGVLRFPSLEARIQHTLNLQTMGWFDYVDAFSLLGTSENEPAPVTLPNPIYKLFLLRSNSAAAQYRAGIPKGLNALMWEKHNAVYKEYNSQIMLYCESSWCNEAYIGFGIGVYPNIEANMRIMATLNDLGWPANMECISLLGTSG